MKFENLHLLNDVVMDYDNPEKIYKLAFEYDKLKQGAAAFGWYLRAADMSKGDTFESKWLQYKSILRGAAIFDRAGNRDHTTGGLYKMAIQTLPERPEAYYLYSKWQMNRSDWREALVYSKMGLNCDHDPVVDPDLDYPGVLGLKYVNAMSEWKTNGRDDSKNLLFDLKYKNKLDSVTDNEVTGVLNNIGYPSTLTYTPELYEKWRWKFDGQESIEKNYSRHFQDMFVLAFTNGKKHGTFIEIGSGHPELYNNTLLLEKDFGWKGLSVDNSERFCSQFSRSRNTTIIQAEADKIDYNMLFKSNCVENFVDFIRYNADSASITALQNTPFDKYEFTVIQVQHNACWWGDEVKAKSREILSNIGYVLFVPDVAINETDNYEDWWIHPGFLTPMNERMKAPEDTNFAWRYMMKEYRV